MCVTHTAVAAVISRSTSWQNEQGIHQQGASTQKHMEQHLHSYDALCNTWNPSPQPCQDVLSDVVSFSNTLITISLS